MPVAAACARRLRRVASHVAPTAADGAAAATAAPGTAGADRRLLSEQEIASFWADGFVVVHGLFAPEELQPFRDIVNTWLGEVARELVEMGSLSSTFADLDIFERMAAMDAEAPGCSLTIQDAFMRDRKLGDESVWSLPALRGLRGDDRLLDIFEQLIGPEVAAHPNAVLRCRAPTPAIGADGGKVPWHQDAGYLLGDAVDTTVLGVWMPLCDVTTTLDNGYLEMQPLEQQDARQVLQHHQAPSYLVVASPQTISAATLCARIFLRDCVVVAGPGGVRAALHPPSRSVRCPVRIIRALQLVHAA